MNIKVFSPMSTNIIFMLHNFILYLDTMSSKRLLGFGGRNWKTAEGKNKILNNKHNLIFWVNPKTKNIIHTYVFRILLIKGGGVVPTLRDITIMHQYLDTNTSVVMLMSWRAGFTKSFRYRGIYRVREMWSQLFVTLYTYTIYIYPSAHKQLRRHLPYLFFVNTPI